jgi:hypothetical protein
MDGRMGLAGTENREQRTENREQRTEDRKQEQPRVRGESRVAVL